VQPIFGTSFPIRFDYLDTYGGGNLSVHCHPREDYMKAVFGWPYAQHESYYMMVGGAERRVFLGLREDVDLDAFQRQTGDADHAGARFEITRYVRTFPASEHQLFLIPAGTPHGSGEGNVVLEVSATPYLYSLRFYDWLRRDTQGSLRPVHIAHAFANLDRKRRGDAVGQDLVQAPRQVRSGVGWQEEVLGALPDMFFEVRRMTLAPGAVAEDDTADRFHVLNVVEGDGMVLQPQVGPTHSLSYAETVVVPAAVGPYRLQPLGTSSVRVVKATVRC
jgi:mannose-6-phosphate isomerase class I